MKIKIVNYLEYPSILVQFEKTDVYWPKAWNWVPKHQEIADILAAIIKVEPIEKKLLLYNQFKNAMEDAL